MQFFIKRLILLCLISLSIEASQWKLQNMEFRHAESVYDHYIYIPDGEYFKNNELVGDLFGSNYHSHIEVHLDDRLISIFSLREHKNFKINLPSMKSGFHKLTILGLPDTLMLSMKSNKVTNCPKMRELPFGLEKVFINFQSEIVSMPTINKYQEVLFNPAFPSDRPLIGSLVFEEETSTVLSAASRIISGIKAPMRGIHYVKGENNDTDFSLVFKKVETLNTDSSIMIERRKRVVYTLKEKQIYKIEPARLTFYYNDDTKLLDSVNALLNKRYLKPLHNISVDINDSVEEPEWGILKEYKTLKDLGVNDTRLTGDGTTKLLLNYPIYWRATDRLKGKILIRSQSALPQDTHLNIWLDEVLSGSQAVAYLGSGDIQRIIPVDGLYIPKKHIVKLDLDAILSTRKICDVPTPGTLWISSEDSLIEMPHRQKTGIMSLLPALVSKPTIELFPISTGTLSAAATFIQEQQKVTGDKPLAYNVSNAIDNNDTTLHIEVNKKAIKNFFSENLTALNFSLISDSIWLHSEKDGKLKVIAPNDKTLQNLSGVWSKVINKINDGAIDVIIDTVCKEVLIINEKKSLKDIATTKMSNDEYKYAVIIIGLIFTILIIWILLRIYRKVVKK